MEKNRPAHEIRIGAVKAVIWANPTDSGVPICWSQAAFGIDCPLCGGLRCTNALLRGDLAALHEAGAIGKVTMREFDAICPPPVREFSAADIKHLRERLKFSQPVFALHLHTTASTVRKWEQGETHPTGPALKLLNVIADKGLQAII